MTSRSFHCTSQLPSLSTFTKKNMPSPSITISCRLQNERKVPIRPTAEFHPSLWGDRFSNYVAEPKVLVDEKEERVNKMKEDIRRAIVSTTTNPSTQMKLIADVQRLGVGYHFEKEIEEALTRIYENYRDYEVNHNDPGDLHDVSLRFRLLRQQGIGISCDIFNKFKDKSGKLNETLVEDIHGMLGLYEASHFRKHGEDILDEALVFTTTHLRHATQTNSDLQANKPLLSQVEKALLHPIRKNIGRLEARYYMSVYDQMDSYKEQLFKLAKIDFNLVQSLHKKELSDLTGWWKELNLATRIPFGRDRVVEAYFWMVGIYSDPQYSFGRIILTKVNKLISYINDTYDSYGTIEELELFTDAFQRWDINSKDQLPDYMQIIYEATLNLFVEIEEEMVKQGRPYYAHYAKETVKWAVKSYFQEAKWRHQENVPTMEEYIGNGIVSSIYPLAGFISLLGVNELATKETVEWLYNIPPILRASSIMARLRNDIVSHKRERERGHVASGVECYMKEYGVSEQEAYQGLKKIMINEWKHINGECLKPSNYVTPKDLMKIFVNLASTLEVYYTEGDAYTHVGKEMKARIASLLVDPIPI